MSKKESTLTASRRWCGLVWKARSEAELNALPDITNREEMKVLKKNLYRTVSLIPSAAGEPGLILKSYRMSRTWDRWKQMFRGSRARKEWFEAHRLKSLGIPTIDPIAFGEEREGRWIVRSELLMREFPDATDLMSYLRTQRSLAPRKMLIESLARDVQRLYEAGIFHRDLHGKNILVRERAAAPEYRIIDLQSVSQLPLGTQAAREKNLVPLFRSLMRGGSTADALRFCRAYIGSTEARALFQRLLRWDEAALRRHRLSRMKRCIDGGSQYIVEGRRPARIRRTEVDSADLARLEGELALVKEEGVQVDLLIAGKRRRCWAKRFERRGPARSKAAWLGLRALEVWEIPSARGLAWRTCWVIMDYLEGRDPLGRWFRANADRLAPADRRALTNSLSRLVRDIHRKNIYHNDFSPKNFLIQRTEDGWSVYLVDPEAVRWPTTLSLRRKAKNLGQIADLGDQVTRTDRLRFLKSYLGPGWRSEMKSLARNAWSFTRKRIDRRIDHFGNPAPTEP